MSLHIGVPIFFIAALLQAAVLPQFRVFEGQPDLVVIVVLAWAILDQGQEGLFWAFVGGLALDLFSGAPFGISSLALMLVAYVVSQANAQLYRVNVVPPILLTAAGAFAYHVLYLILLRFLVGYAVVWAEALLYVTLPSVIFDLLLIVPVLQVLARVYDAIHPRQVSI